MKVCIPSPSAENVMISHEYETSPAAAHADLDFDSGLGEWVKTRKQ
jgi:hypothetical protein